MNTRTIYAVLDESTASWGDKPAMYQPLGGGEYRIYSWNEYREAVREVAAGLRQMGARKGDIVALASETRAEFYLADIGVMTNGSIAAALYTSYPAEEMVRTLRACEAKVVFAEDLETMCALQEAANPPLAVQWILLTGEGEGAISLESLRESGRRAMAADAGFFERIRAEVKASDDAILYLTSGATGEPKMALVSHYALVSNIDNGPAVLPVGPEDCTIVFLPSAHIAQRVVIELVPLRMGAPVWFSEGLSKLPAELKRVKPTFFLAPPRVWERVHASISAEIRKRPALVQKMFYGALGLGLKAARLRLEGKPVPRAVRIALKAADKAIFRQIRERLGGRMRIAASGAAPLGKHLADFYSAIGLPLVEGYGLTEGGVVSFNRLDRAKAGSIGTALPGIKVRLAEDGELLVKSPSVFSGYFRDPEATAAVLRDGWLHTGDIAEIDSEDYIYITGRKKEMIISSNGKKIYPSRVEVLFKANPLINQVVLLGDRQPYVTALITLNFGVAATLKGMARDGSQSPSEVVTAEPVMTEVRKIVSAVNAQLAPFEQIRKFTILDRDFSIERGELTPTMKVRRTHVIENFRHVVNDLYAGKLEVL